jgi:hypothetical protein
MKLPRRNFLHLATGAAALPAVSRFAWAQPFPAGGPTDTIGRIVAEGMRVSLRQPVSVRKTEHRTRSEFIRLFRPCGKSRGIQNVTLKNYQFAFFAIFL